jgi:hypothetical protein
LLRLFTIFASTQCYKGPKRQLILVKEKGASAFLAEALASKFTFVLSQQVNSKIFQELQFRI